MAAATHPLGVEELARTGEMLAGFSTAPGIARFGRVAITAAGGSQKRAPAPLVVGHGLDLRELV